MKKIFSLFALAGMLLVAAGVASAATEVKIKGAFDFGFGLYKGTSHIKHDGQDNFDTMQRLRSQIDFIANESLKGVALFEIGNIYWGNGGGSTYGWHDSAGRSVGGAMGADGVNVEIKNLYLDWVVPETELQLRMGIQTFGLPVAVMRSDLSNGNPIIDDDLAGILLSYNFTEEVGATLGWFRPWNPYAYGEAGGPDGDPLTQHDAVDMFTFTLPLEFKEQFKLTPWFMYASVGQVDSEGWDPAIHGANMLGMPATIATWLSGNGMLGAGGNAWWTGFAFDLSCFDPLFVAVDFMYGSYSADDVNSSVFGTVDPDRSGWAAVAKIGYKLDYFTPAIFGWYGSGSDNLGKEGFDGLLPVLSPYFGMTTFGGVQNHFGGRDIMIGGPIFGGSPGGTWAVGLEFGDIKLIDNLTSALRVAYFEGTSDRGSMAKGIALPTLGLMTTDDRAVEVNLDSVYKIYDNLDLFVELAYINLDIDNAPSDFESNAWKGYVGFAYYF